MTIPKGDPWKLRHIEALTSPTEPERWLVSALRIVSEATDRWSTDGVLDGGVVDMIRGVRTLLIAEHGGRLDMGLVDTALIELAARCGYCLDHDEWCDGCLDGRTKA